MDAKRVNAIEKKNGMGCMSCKIKSICRIARGRNYEEDFMINYICGAYVNPEKGVYEDMSKTKKVAQR